MYECIENTAKVFFLIPNDIFVTDQTDDSYCKTDYCEWYIPEVGDCLVKGIVPYFGPPTTEAYYRYELN